MAGKKILTIPVSSANLFTKNIDLAMIAVAKQTASRWSSGRTRPVRRSGCKASNTPSTTGSTRSTCWAAPIRPCSPAGAAGEEGGVKIFVSHLYDTNQTDPNVDLSLPIPITRLAILAAW
jgi:hypothetical protein